MTMNRQLYFYIGTYTEPILFGTGQVMPGKGEGIYLYKMNLEDGSLTFCDVFRNIRNPSYLAIGSSNQYLFCVNELKDFGGEVAGGVSSFAIEQGSGRLTPLNTVSTRGGDPCYVCVDKEEEFVFVSNFMSGSVILCPIGPEGILGEASCVVQHQGSSIHPLRQRSPHAHSVVLDRMGTNALVPDLGIDKIVQYKVDYSRGIILGGDSLDILTPPGSGPRHCVFNHRGNRLYGINELSLALSVYEYNEQTHHARLLQSIVPVEKENEDCLGADIGIHPNGRFLYASIRGMDLLVTCRIDEQSGNLCFTEKQGSGGKTPRNFAIDPTGRYLLAGNQNSDTVAVFDINQSTGSLTEVFRLEVPTPVCIKPVWL
jgi:6-phosphogluconolactonase